jgi:hypothetical protein
VPDVSGAIDVELGDEDVTGSATPAADGHEVDDSGEAGSRARHQSRMTGSMSRRNR